MANRAYLYSVDKKPTKENREIIKIRGLAEWNYQIPLCYLILISGSPELSSSLVWDNSEKIAIIGKYDEGLSNLELLLNFIKSDIQYPEMFVGVLNRSLEFLKSNKVKQTFIVLEPGELLDMSGNVSEESVKQIISDSQLILQAVKDRNIDVINKYLGDDVRTHWEDLLGTNSWAEILYFDINQN